MRPVDLAVTIDAAWAIRTAPPDVRRLLEPLTRALESGGLDQQAIVDAVSSAWLHGAHAAIVEYAAQLLEQGVQTTVHREPSSAED